MDERSFVAGSRETWERLAAAVARARDEGVARMGVPAIRQMHEDYRQAAADLAYAQTHFPGTATETYLNRLVAQAHGELYGTSPHRLSSLWRFLVRDWPRLVRREWRIIALAAGLLFGATALAYLLVYVDYPLARLFIPEALRGNIADRFQQNPSSGADLIAEIAPLLSIGITVNNIQVALMAFAGGMTFGLLTVYAMVQNGLLLGALAGVAGKAGYALPFWALIVPHGALELPAIALAGGAGLMLARALLFPGDLPRGEALRAISGTAVRLVLGTVPLFVVAGTVEGFFTPRPFDPVLKVAVGAALAVALAVYIGFAGRSESTGPG